MVACNSQMEDGSLDLGCQFCVARRRHSVHYGSSSRLDLTADLVAILTSPLTVAGH